MKRFAANDRYHNALLTIHDNPVRARIQSASTSSLREHYLALLSGPQLRHLIKVVMVRQA